MMKRGADITRQRMRVRCIFMHQWCMSSAHIEMNAAMNGLSSYSIRLDWNSYTQRIYSHACATLIPYVKWLSPRLEFRKCTRSERANPSIRSRFLKIIWSSTTFYHPRPTPLAPVGSLSCPLVYAIPHNWMSNEHAKLDVRSDIL